MPFRTMVFETIASACSAIRAGRSEHSRTDRRGPRQGARFHRVTSVAPAGSKTGAGGSAGLPRPVDPDRERQEVARQCQPSCSPAKDRSAREWAGRGPTTRPGRWSTTPPTPPAATSAHLLLDASVDGADRDPQRPAGHVHLQPGGPRRRRAARHRADRRGRPLRRRVHRPGGRRGARLRGRRARGRRAGRGHAGGGRRPAGGDGGRERLRRRHGGHRLPAGRRRGVGGQLTTAPTRRSSPARPTPWSGPAPERSLLGARRSRPVAVGGAFHTPFMAPARQRLRKALAAATFHDARDPRRGQRRRLGPYDRRGLASPPVGPAVQPGPLAPEHHCASAGWHGPRRRHRAALRRARTRRLPVDPDPPDPAQRDDAWPSPRPTTSTAWSTPSPATRPARLRRRPPGRAPLRLRAGGHQPGGRRLRADDDSPRRSSTPAPASPSRSAPCSARSSSRRCAPRSPAADGHAGPAGRAGPDRPAHRLAARA